MCLSHLEYVVDPEWDPLLMIIEYLTKILNRQKIHTKQNRFNEPQKPKAQSPNRLMDFNEAINAKCLFMLDYYFMSNSSNQLKTKYSWMRRSRTLCTAYMRFAIKKKSSVKWIKWTSLWNDPNEREKNTNHKINFIGISGIRQSLM